MQFPVVIVPCQQGDAVGTNSHRPCRNRGHSCLCGIVVVEPPRDPTARRRRGIRVAGDGRGARALRARRQGRDRGDVARCLGAARLCGRRHAADFRQSRNRSQIRHRLCLFCASRHRLLRVAGRRSLPPRYYAVHHPLGRRRYRTCGRRVEGGGAVRGGQHLRRAKRIAAGHPPLSRRTCPVAAVHGDVGRHGGRRGDDPCRLCGVAGSGIAALPARCVVHGGARRTADGKDHHA